ncbi:hypothetical protein [Paludisphaera borealis]|nr:hypothetical protein [Paludisphaera borealis]MDR3620149.1 hypothetical protein [Paludisphaera borealis]
MDARRIGRPLAAIAALAILVPPLQFGCGDDSRTSGTQVQISPEAKAQIKDMKDMYKDMNKGAAKKKR